jgi:hypothetical protein
MIVYNTRDYWVLGPYPSSSILKTREHVSETDPVFEMLCCLVFRVLDDGQSPKT